MGYITQSAPNPYLRALKFVLFIVVVLVAIGAYLYLHPDIWQEWVKGTPLEPAPTVTRVYKWQDSRGQWQITDTPPPENVQYEELEYRSDTNVMPLVPGEED